MLSESKSTSVNQLPRHEMAQPSQESIRVLLIEDSDIDATFVCRLLMANPRFPIVVDRAATLAAALNMLRSADYDLAMLDISLPDAVGLESFDQLAHWMRDCRSLCLPDSTTRKWR